jgi:hypothetical protein
MPRVPGRCERPRRPTEAATVKAMSGLTPGIVREVDPAHPGAMDSADAAFQFDVLTKFAEVRSEELNESLQRDFDFFITPSYATTPAT